MNTAAKAPGPITLRRATVADAADHARIMGDPAVLPGGLETVKLFGSSGPSVTATASTTLTS